MFVDFLRERFRANPDRDAIVWRDRPYSYAWLTEAVAGARATLAEQRVSSGTVVSLEADFSPMSVAMLLAIIDSGGVLVPLTDSVEAQKPEFRDVAEVELVVAIDADGVTRFRRTGTEVRHPLLLALRGRQHPGLVLFSSGSTGKSKAALHDMVPLLEKFKVPRRSMRTITFLLFDHIGGFNTLFYTLSNAGCVITVDDRSPDHVCRTIEKHEVQLLPTSPTFLNLILLSEAHRRHDLSTLELVTYGTEVMPESTLERFRAVVPHVQMLQTYGLSELGILRSKSKSSDSPWVKLGGEGFQTRVVDGLLEIKAESAMLGYLNHESPFTDDGWFKTGDSVEVDGEYLRILGRRSEIINVGGEKVYPAEVESVLQLMDGVEEVTVRGAPNAITGQIVVARVKLASAEAPQEFRRRMDAHCRKHLPRFKIPQKIELSDEGLHGARFKKTR